MSGGGPGSAVFVTVHAPGTQFPTGSATVPILLAATLDVSLATTYRRTVTATVCDNTMAIALGQARGQRVKIRHSRLSGLRIEEARRALSVVEGPLTSSPRRCGTCRRWWCRIGSGLRSWTSGIRCRKEAGRSCTIAFRVREELVEVYRRDVRACIWRGSAFGWCRR
ncbi:DUF932 domain-containing protein [Rhodococcus sp. ACS1]|uniref:DUF932 domain-containing protein n=2 Tax=Rhodococcus TaxID=1827 RepID=UPI0015CA63D9